MKSEKRYFPIESVRAEETDGQRSISGYAAVFYKLSEDLGGFREKIAKGAFKNSVASGDVRAFWSHNSDIVLGRTKANSLKIWEDEYGLAFKLDLPDTQAGRDAFTLIKRGDVTGMSFGFATKKDAWERGIEGSPAIRTLMDVDLFEVSPTAFPAYPQTNVGVRDLESALEALKEVEKEWMWADHEKNGTKVEDVRSRLTKREAACKLAALRAIPLTQVQ